MINIDCGNIYKKKKKKKKKKKNQRKAGENEHQQTIHEDIYPQ